MLHKLQRWKANRRLGRLINHATKIIYSEQTDFLDLVPELAFHHIDATLEEIHLAIQCVVKIEDELQSLVHSKYKIRDRDVIKQVMTEALGDLHEILEAESDEIKEARVEICALKAEKAFCEIRMAFTLEALQSEESFAGAVYKAKKIRNGPITIEERRTFKRLAEQLADANEKISRIDEELAAAGELTPDIAEEIVTAFYDVLLAKSEIKLMDASDLPYSRETILEARNFLTEYLTDLRTTNPQVFQQQQCDVLLNASQTLCVSLDLFYDIDPDDKERVADLNNNWREIEDRIKNDVASESDQLWMQQAKRLVVKYRFR